jgi:hypothetical protein
LQQQLSKEFRNFVKECLKFAKIVDFAADDLSSKLHSGFDTQVENVGVITQMQLPGDDNASRIGLPPPARRIRLEHGAQALVKGPCGSLPGRAFRFRLYRSKTGEPVILVCPFGT